MDALKAASDAARVAQMAANGVGLAEGAKAPTAEEVAAALELANAKRKEAGPIVYSIRTTTFIYPPQLICFTPSATGEKKKEQKKKRNTCSPRLKQAPLKSRAKQRCCV